MDDYPYGEHNPAYISTRFMFWCLVVSFILAPFIWCAQSVGLMDPPDPPTLEETRGYTCDLRTEAQCVQRRLRKKAHPEWYD
jgi:hypothetical protein